MKGVNYVIEVRKIILIGAGFSGTTHWIPAIVKSASFQLLGVIDHNEIALQRALEVAPPNIWAVSNVSEIPSSIPMSEIIILVATPDHFPTIREFSKAGFRCFIVEKPLVSRMREIGEFKHCIQKYQLKIYSVDHYYQKFLPLEFVLGRLAIADPRISYIKCLGDHKLDEITGCLGTIEGVTYTNIEGDELGIPYLNNHPWMEHDPEIGGIIHDLGPHAFAPLIRIGLTSAQARIHDVGLSRLTPSRDSLEPVRHYGEFEMYARVLMTAEGITTNVTFGKVPFRKERSLAVRGEKGVFFAGLGRGQHSVVMTAKKTTRLSLIETENDIVLREAIAFFNGELSTFDGNIKASIDALYLNERIRKSYFTH